MGGLVRLTCHNREVTLNEEETLANSYLYECMLLRLRPISSKYRGLLLAYNHSQSSFKILFFVFCSHRNVTHCVKPGNDTKFSVFLTLSQSLWRPFYLPSLIRGEKGPSDHPIQVLLGWSGILTSVLFSLQLNLSMIDLETQRWGLFSATVVKAWEFIN